MVINNDTLVCILNLWEKDGCKTLVQTPLHHYAKMQMERLCYLNHSYKKKGVPGCVCVEIFLLQSGWGLMPPLDLIRLNLIDSKLGNFTVAALINMRKIQNTMLEKDEEKHERCAETHQHDKPLCVPKSRIPQMLKLWMSNLDVGDSQTTASGFSLIKLSHYHV